MSDRALVLCGVLFGAVAVQASGYLYRQPAVNQTHVVFSYAGDLWSVPRTGGDAIRLTTGPGVESDPIFSPDGSQIAFSGDYDGNRDVFVMPAAGGTPKRLTYHPGQDAAAGWTRDGKRVLFVSGRTTAMDGGKLFTMPVEGGFPEEIPLPIALKGSFSPDGSQIAYVPLFQWQQAWKRYRGGQTSKIWIAKLADSSVTPLPRENSNDSYPMWVGDTIYFLSDRNGPVSLFSYDTRTRQVKQLIENRGFDFKSASAGFGVIAYEQFGSLHLYDLKSGKGTPLAVRLNGDLPEVRPRFVNVAKRLRYADLSPNGARAVFEARGEILTVPAEKGDARNLTRTPGVMEREPVWSPDGKTVGYFSDESGDYELHLRDQGGMGEPVKIGLGQPAFYFAPVWSPDSKKIAYLDNHLGIWYVDLETKKPVRVDQDLNMSERERAPVWSPDSKWLAYVKQLPNYLSAVYLYSIEEARATQVTDGMSEARYVTFDKDGKYLYFTASTDSGPNRQPDILSRTRPWTRSVYLIVLAKDLPSPFAPESDDEKPGAAEKEKKDDKPSETPPVKVDLAGIGQRILAVPLPARRYDGLGVGKAGVLFAVEAPAPTPGSEPHIVIHRYDLGKRKSDVLLPGIREFVASRNGEKALYRKGDQWYIAAVKPMAESGPPPPPAPDPTPLKIDAVEVRAEPRAEWRQMYREAWRIQRDYFYDPNYHGLDLKAAERRYADFLETISSRDDLNYLFTEMLGQLSVGHMFLGGGDKPEVKRVKTGLLGADYKIENGRYRFARIYDGENWNPDLQAPLTQPGVNVIAGEYLLAVNGRELRPSDNVYAYFEATAGKQTVIKVSADPNGPSSREVTVVPVDSESRLRHLAWIEDNRRTVDRLTNGRVAYIHMPDTGDGGNASFNRYFFAQAGKEAAIIDDRFNHGGSLATDIIEHLNRQMMSVVTPRDGADFAQPQGAIFGPKVMLINEFAGSGGDLMPWYFRRFNRGKLIGKRTWGGVVGLSGTPELMDGGVVMSPTALVRPPDGKYEIENEGVAPDIDVELDPKAMREGRDPQLEKAIEVVMAELERSLVTKPGPPAYPTFHGKP